MHVPFSMSDEPDLGDEFNGTTSFASHDDYLEPLVEATPRRTYTQAEVDLILMKMVSRHQEAIDDLRNEILDLHEMIEDLVSPIGVKGENMKTLQQLDMIPLGEAWMNSIRRIPEYAKDFVVGLTMFTLPLTIPFIWCVIYVYRQLRK